MKVWPSYLQSITFTVNNTPCCPPPVLLTKDFFQYFSGKSNQFGRGGNWWSGDSWHLWRITLTCKGKRHPPLSFSFSLTYPVAQINFLTSLPLPQTPIACWLHFHSVWKWLLSPQSACFWPSWSLHHPPGHKRQTQSNPYITHRQTSICQTCD